ncbi:MAG: GNAT family N-acetyltransferase [archaeon]
MSLHQIERIRLAFLEKIVRSEVYGPADLVITSTSEYFPAVLFRRDEPIPMALRTQATFSLRGPVGFIDDLSINPNSRNNGLGTAVYTAVEDAFRESNVIALALYARENPQARIDPHKFWKDRGFTQVSRYCFEKYLE